MNRTTYDHVLKYSGLFGGVQVLSMLMQLLRGKATALLLGPAGMGLSSLFMSVAGFVSQATTFGVSFSAVRQLSSASSDASSFSHGVSVVRAWSFATALLGFLFCVSFGPLFSRLTFSWDGHVLHFVALAPAVALMAIAGGETAILKAGRRLKALALAQLYTAGASIVISVPLYWVWGQSAIVPVIVLTTGAGLLLTVAWSWRLYPPRASHFLGLLRDGAPMLRLGLAFVASGVLGSGAEMLIRSYLNVHGSIDTLGLYNAGYTLCVSYASLVFAAMETDYFPRLSAVAGDNRAVSLSANRQVEVSLLLSSPLLAFLTTVIPIIVPLLFSGKFSPMAGMAQVAVLAMYSKAVALPLSYIQLAKGSSLAFLLLEGLFDAALVLAVVVGWQWGGLWGTGVGVALAYTFDLLINFVWVWWRYDFRLSSVSLRYIAIFIPLGLATYAATFLAIPLLRWGAGIALSSISAAISIYILRRKTSLWHKLIRRFRRS